MTSLRSKRTIAMLLILLVSIAATIADPFADRNGIIGRIDEPILIVGWVLFAVFMLDYRRREENRDALLKMSFQLAETQCEVRHLEQSVAEYGDQRQSHGTVLALRRQIPASRTSMDVDTIAFAATGSVYAGSTSNVSAIITAR